MENTFRDEGEDFRFPSDTYPIQEAQGGRENAETPQADALSTRWGFPVLPEVPRALDSGLGMAVARRTVFRKSDQDNWGNVASRVAAGNVSLARLAGRLPDSLEEGALRNAIARGALLTSGRHLQHGDESQIFRNQTVFTNCSTASTSFLLFLLLLCGSGVGRSYDDSMMLVDWSRAPGLVLVLDPSHPDKDVAWEQRESIDGIVQISDHLPEDISKDSRVFTIPDTREGWAQALEIWESAAFEGVLKTLILDFSLIRPAGAPIGGMQGRPASGPVSLMRAFVGAAGNVVMQSQRNPMPLWEQAIRLDHEFSVEVQVGGARRSARMSTKFWKDPGVLDFARIKNVGGLWTSNNSITVDAEFWGEVRHPGSAAATIFNTATESAYKTGEPGFINADMLDDYRRHLDIAYPPTPPRGTPSYTPSFGRELLASTYERAKHSQYCHITNPCQPAFAPILTPSGISTIGNLHPGDKIWSEDGWVIVNSVLPAGIKRVMQYRTGTGTVYATPEHKIAQAGKKIEIMNALGVDTLAGPPGDLGSKSPFAVMDGLMIGDGSKHTQSACKVYLTIGSRDHDYFSSEISHLIIEPHPVKKSVAWKVKTSVSPDELPNLPERRVPSRYLYSNREESAAFLRGLFSANGSVVSNANQFRVTLKTTSPTLLRDVQMMLSACGLPSYFTTNRATSVKWPNGVFTGRTSFDVNIPRAYCQRFLDEIGFLQRYKVKRLQKLLSKTQQIPHRVAKITYDIRRVDDLGDMPVFDINVSGEHHTYWSGGCNVSNCGEISLHVCGGFCVLADVSPTMACGVPFDSFIPGNAPESVSSPWDNAVRGAVTLASRFLVRSNLMDSIYAQEVARTNRIGVGLTGLHEWAWLRWGLGFRDLLDASGVAKPFWEFVESLSTLAKSEASAYSESLGVRPPFTTTTIKPSGTMSKLHGITEGAHLPARRGYIRWVQFKGAMLGDGLDPCLQESWDIESDPLISELIRDGYPWRALKTFPGIIIVGFPTRPLITQLGMGDVLVTAPEATPDEQYQWLRLLERYWLGDSGGNQVSYTLKLYTSDVSLESFRSIVLRNQPTVRCCAILPCLPESQMPYEYLPEETVSDSQLAALESRIMTKASEVVDIEDLRCASGVCPL